LESTNTCILFQEEEQVSPFSSSVCGGLARSTYLESANTCILFQEEEQVFPSFSPHVLWHCNEHILKVSIFFQEEEQVFLSFSPNMLRPCWEHIL